MGIATGRVFAHRGRTVFAYDLNPNVRSSLRRGRSPYREEGLQALLRTEARRGRFRVVDEWYARSPRRRTASFSASRLLPRETGRLTLARCGPPLAPWEALFGPSADTVWSSSRAPWSPGRPSRWSSPCFVEPSGKGPNSLGVAANPEFLSEGRMVHDARYRTDRDRDDRLRTVTASSGQHTRALKPRSWSSRPPAPNSSSMHPMRSSRSRSPTRTSSLAGRSGSARTSTTWSPRSEPTRGSGLLSCGPGPLRGKLLRQGPASVPSSRRGARDPDSVRRDRAGDQCRPNDPRLRAGPCCRGNPPRKDRGDARSGLQGGNR